MIDSVLWPAAISFIRSDGTLGAFHYHAVPKIYKLGKFKAETSANSWHSSVWYALKPGHWEVCGKLDTWLFISRFNDLMMLYSLLKLLTISVSKMLLEEGRVWEFPALFLSDFLGMDGRRLLLNAIAITMLLFLLCFAFPENIILSQIIIMLDTHIHIYQSLFPPRGFLEWWWLKYYLSFYQDNIANMHVYNRFSHPSCLEISLNFT